jgi:hypothetical protein
MAATATPGEQTHCGLDDLFGSANLVLPKVEDHVGARAQYICQQAAQPHGPGLLTA